MGLMNSSDEAAQAGTGGWMDGTTYMAGLSGGSWATGSFMANGGRDALDLVNNVSLFSVSPVMRSDIRFGIFNPT